jgi:glutamate synthase domain-containing protein 3
MLKTWPSTANDFIKVMPKDYKRVLQNIEVALDSGLSEEDAILEAMNG